MRSASFLFLPLTHPRWHRFTMDALTRQALAIWNAGVEAVRSDTLVERSLSVNRNTLQVAGEGEYSLQNVDRILVIGGGKAAAGMAAGFARFWNRNGGSRIQISGWLHAPEGTFQHPVVDCGNGAIRLHAARAAGKNEPAMEGVVGANKMLEMANSANSRTLVLCFISGGASALMPSPIPGLSLDDKLAVTRHLSQSGADIEVLNEVRRCLSRIKGGGLARAAARAQRVVSLILSDVLGDPLHLIGSGPTVLDPPPNPVLALELLKKWDPEQRLPSSISRCLNAMANGSASGRHPSPGCPVDHWILANNATAVDAAGTRAVELNFAYWMESSRTREGDVGAVASKLFRGIELSRQQGQPDCLISGGEPTVQLPSSGTCGRGGRNQQLALHLVDLFENHPDPKIQEGLGISVVCGGTDGEDGPTDAAGAIVNQEVISKARQLRLKTRDYLDRCDAYSFFKQAGGLLMTGPTHTNVCDLRVVLIRP